MGLSSPYYPMPLLYVPVLLFLTTFRYISYSLDEKVEGLGVYFLLVVVVEKRGVFVDF